MTLRRISRRHTGHNRLASTEMCTYQGKHPAKNRNYALYLAVKEKAEPIMVPHLVLDTGTTTLEECVQRCLGYLRRPM